MKKWNHIFLLCFFCLFLLESHQFSRALTVPDTGVTKCYNKDGNQIVCPAPGQIYYGQDAQYGPGNMLLVVNGDGTVTDQNTGLMWELKGESDGLSDLQNPNDPDNVYTWADAWNAVNQLNAMRFAGYSDWRLPTPDELNGIVDLGRSEPGPTVDTDVFQNTRKGPYWTSQDFAGDITKAWAVDFRDGSSSYFDKSLLFHIRAVRGGI